MRSISRRTVAFATANIALAALAASAHADSVPFMLHNPAGANAADYGFRLDELYDATSDHDMFTFDFNAPASSMRMTIDRDAGEVRIFGTAVGGRDLGPAYAADQYQGLYTIDMLYIVGLQSAGGNDLQINAPNHSNWGTIITPLGEAIPLADFRASSDFSLSIGAQGDGASVLGWVNHGSDAGFHVDASEWNFAAASVPTPGAAALGMLGMGMLATSRKRRR